MKRILKIIMLLIVTIILTGCTVNYNLTINEDNSISEKIEAKENKNRVESLTRLKSEQAVAYMVNMYKNSEDVNYITNIDDDTMTVNAVITYSDINEYQNKFKSDIFEKVDIEREKKIVKISAYQSKILSEDFSDSLLYNDISINITVPYKVIDNNADSITGNTYTWNITRDGELKVIELSYDEGSLKNNLNIKLKNKTYNINYGIIIASGMITSIILIVLLVYVKNKKNNVL